MPPKATGRRCAGASRRSSAANCNWHPTARRRSSHTPNTSPPSCSPDTPTSAAPQRRPKDTTFSKSMWTPWNSSVRARSGSSTWGCGRWTSSGCARASRNSASVRRYVPPPSARSSRAWHARAPSAPPGVGSANAARSMSCWDVDFADPGSRCSLYRASDALMAHRRGHRAPSVRPGDGPVRPAPHGHALRPDQYLLRRRGGRTTQGPPRTLQGKTHRLPAPHSGAGARCQRLRASLAGLRRQRARTSHAGRDARCAQRPARRPGGDGPRHRHRGPRPVAA